MDGPQFSPPPSDAHSIRRRLVQGDTLQNERGELRRRNGETSTAYLTTVPFFSKHGRYGGRGGIVREHDRLLELIPIGFYSVEHRGEKDIIVDCNEEYAKIHDVPSREEMIGVNILDFHESPAET